MNKYNIFADPLCFEIKNRRQGPKTAGYRRKPAAISNPVQRVVQCTLKIIIPILSYLECISALGMSDGRIKDSQITVSGFLKKAYGRLARLRKNIPDWGAWCANVSGGKIRGKNYDQYILIDLLNLTKITRIATQGRQYNGGREWAKDYKLSYRKDGGIWYFYKGKDQAVKVNLMKMFHGCISSLFGTVFTLRPMMHFDS
jgi:hypothetical protein